MRELSTEAVEVLKNGGVILHRPDTIWGLSCDATSDAAVSKIDQIKSRADGKSYIVLVKDDAMMERYVTEVPEVAWDLLDSAVEPITIIYPKGRGLANGVLADDGSVAIRVVKDDLTRNIIQRLNRAIVSTSANISGGPSPTSLAEIDERVMNSVDHVVERTDEAETKKPSTIIKLALNGEFKIIRP